ncbi:hypothetical protein [Pseudobutyrivibrio sp. YE44]|uniref:hypothetical protein n=1 Tax=Pseudobutyrivibrio sp. YE44 TaxID=1520802 RepID=UPI00115FC05F|nr:hypothetical protein [Pseudobutyrivibrio sp. YE44]
MEIKNEEKNATEVVSVKEKTTKNISLLKYYLLLLSLLSTVYLFSYAYSHRINEQFSYSRLFIINYIHDKDGRKR